MSTFTGYCVCANVKGSDGNGTKHFVEGAKVYIHQPNSGEGQERVKVWGRHRGGMRYVHVWMRSKYLTNVLVAGRWGRDEPGGVEGPVTYEARERAERLAKDVARHGVIEVGGWGSGKSMHVLVNMMRRAHGLPPARIEATLVRVGEEDS